MGEAKRLKAVRRAQAALNATKAADEGRSHGVSAQSLRQSQMDELMKWLTSHHCSKKCGLDLKTWDNITNNQCKTDCSRTCDRIRQASDAVRPGDEQLIEFPIRQSSKISLHPSNDK